MSWAASASRRIKTFHVHICSVPAICFVFARFRTIAYIYILYLISPFAILFFVGCVAYAACMLTFWSRISLDSGSLKCPWRDIKLAVTIPNGIQRRDRRHRREGLRVRACTDLFKTYRCCDSDTVALVVDVPSPALTVDGWRCCNFWLCEGSTGVPEVKS